MSSPFTTVEDFNGAIDGPTEGAIYTFAQSPIINNIALLVAVGLFIWFISKTYSSHRAPASRIDKSINHLSTLIVVGFLSLVAADYRQPRPTDVEQRAQREAVSEVQATRAGVSQTGQSQPSAKKHLPLGLMGLVGTGALPLRWGRKKQRARKYRPHR